MTIRIRKSLALLRFELGTHYRFPIVESVIAFVLGLSLVVIIASAQDLHLSITHGPAWNGSEQADYFLEIARTTAVSVFSVTGDLLSYVVAFVVPMIVGFNLGKGIENGFAETTVSYPVSRRSLIAVKAAALISLVLICGLGIPFLCNLLFIPSEKPADSFLLVAFSFSAYTVLVASTSLLLSIIGRRASASAVGGTAMWLLLLLIVSTTDRYPLVRGIINPVQIASDYLFRGTTGPLFADVLISSAMCLLLGVLVLVACILLFERADL